MSNDYGMTCPLKIGDKCRIVKSANPDEIDLIGFIVEEVAPGTQGFSRTEPGMISTNHMTWCLDIAPRIAFIRNCLYKLPPDFDQVIERAAEHGKLLPKPEAVED